VLWECQLRRAPYEVSEPAFVRVSHSITHITGRSFGQPLHHTDISQLSSQPHIHPLCHSNTQSHMPPLRQSDIRRVSLPPRYPASHNSSHVSWTYFQPLHRPYIQLLRHADKPLVRPQISSHIVIQIICKSIIQDIIRNPVSQTHIPLLCQSDSQLPKQ
jgi:hypothetical protein